MTDHTNPATRIRHLEAQIAELTRLTDRSVTTVHVHRDDTGAITVRTCAPQHDETAISTALAAVLADPSSQHRDPASLETAIGRAMAKATSNPHPPTPPDRWRPVRADEVPLKVGAVVRSECYGPGVVAARSRANPGDRRLDFRQGQLREWRNAAQQVFLGVPDDDQQPANNPPEPTTHDATRDTIHDVIREALFGDGIPGVEWYARFGDWSWLGPYKTPLEARDEAAKVYGDVPDDFACWPEPDPVDSD